MDIFSKSLPLYTAPISVLANFLLINLIIFKSPAQMGNYKYLLIGVSLFEIFYGILDFLAETRVLSVGPSFVVVIPYKDRFFDKKWAEFLNCLYCGFFGFSMGMFVIIFAYRLFVATENQILQKFKGPKIIFWFLYPFLHLALFYIDAWLPYSPFPEMDEFVGPDILKSLNLSLDDVAYTGPLFYSKITNSVRIPTMVVSMLQYLFTKQLFFALVFQAMVPIILMHIPVTILYTCSLLDIIFRLPVESTIALFPALDPFPTIFIVKSYRNTILEMTTPPNLEDMPDVVLSNIFEKTGISGM
ncbi:Protein CBR-STR-217 [Caenorhabditis briggsae]|uniref:Protein CBR-STR-217 n=1 Tax=Caenorhabditis briggsae TaxID=6238 RepID=A8XTQ5_CAEBR|nr:Protein CBR-STR-217 [Caenorhabditis briggsae]CAP36031.2 Protein CBR-STR-217 [Caenorhabditis briggsae]